MKKNKLNNSGFMMVELLVVTVAIMIIFTSLYINFYPTVGEYEKRMDYNDVLSTYKLFYFRTDYLQSLITEDNKKTDPLKDNDYIVLVSNGSCNNQFLTCSSLVNNLQISDVIITKNMEVLKSNLDSLSIDSSFKDYINYLPNYKDTEKTYRLVMKTEDGYATSSLYSFSCVDVLGNEKGYGKCEANSGKNCIAGYYIQEPSVDNSCLDEEQICQIKDRPFKIETTYTCSSGEVSDTFNTQEECTLNCSACTLNEVVQEEYDECESGYDIDSEDESKCKKCTCYDAGYYYNENLCDSNESFYCDNNAGMNKLQIYKIEEDPYTSPCN